MEDYSNINTTGITVEANCGAVLGECVAEAAQLSLSKIQKVTLIHGEKTFHIDPVKIITSITSKETP